ncbi:uncharacterized protein DSM5745_00808 [Aspergillus mulundensis]|uniref:Myb-like domain-containing protein n=1 Tax=Aspergillus mulundensis TaxID=1810919 RepID=A0A3D8T4K7_9EURO|nr:hypothetical protein DSM5745_00808 [Aspergillus mulundensis]RDW93486.1 hypothetical protein DSM5745_00808 [Aspergillus mulundensis]
MTRPRWTDEEQRRLVELRELHSYLTWTEFHNLQYFPGRTRVAIYHEYLRLRVQDGNENENENENMTPQPEPAREGHNSPSNVKAKRQLASSGHRQPRPEKRPRLDEEDAETASNSEDGDIEIDGRRQPMQTRASPSVNHAVSIRNPPKDLATPTTPAAPRILAALSQETTVCPIPSWPAVPALEAPVNNPSERIQISQTPAPVQITSLPAANSTDAESCTAQGLREPTANTPVLISGSNDTVSLPTASTDEASSIRTPEPEVPVSTGTIQEHNTFNEQSPGLEIVESKLEPPILAASRSPEPLTPAQCLNYGLRYLHQFAELSGGDQKPEKKKAKDFEAAIAALQQRLDQSEAAQQELRKQLESQTTEIEALKAADARNERLSTETDDLKKRLESLEEQQKEYRWLYARQGDLSSLKTNMKRKMEDLGSQISKIGKVADKANKLRKTFQGLEEWRVSDMLHMIASTSTSTRTRSPGFEEIPREEARQLTVFQRSRGN